MENWSRPFPNQKLVGNNSFQPQHWKRKTGNRKCTYVLGRGGGNPLSLRFIVPGVCLWRVFNLGLLNWVPSAQCGQPSAAHTKRGNPSLWTFVEGTRASTDCGLLVDAACPPLGSPGCDPWSANPRLPLRGGPGDTDKLHRLSPFACPWGGPGPVLQKPKKQTPGTHQELALFVKT